MLNLAYIGAKNFEFRPITGFVFFCFKINKSSYWSKFKIFGANVGLIKHITPCQTDMYPCPNSNNFHGHEKKSILLHNLDPMFNIKSGFFFQSDGGNAGFIEQVERFSVFDTDSITKYLLDF